MKVAILCSGQGPQHAGMFALAGDAPGAAAIFASAALLLDGRDPRDLVHREDPPFLHVNRVGQILCTVQALAARAALQDAWPARCIVAGYSVGEVAAWGVAGLVEPGDTLRLVARRAKAMDACCAPGDGLLFVRGLPRPAIDELCTRCGVEIAIVNPADAFVLGGSATALDCLDKAARSVGATRIVRLDVAVASHTPRLSAASDQFRAELQTVAMRSALPPGVRLLSGIDGAPVVNIARAKDKLAAQISRTVVWADCLQACIEAGASAFLELGPGKALSQMAASAFPGVPARALDDFRTIQGVRDWLRCFN